jgi:Zn-finger nucleic acid-binding protein
VTAPQGSNDGVFFALDHMHQWQGPYTLVELAVLPWLTTLTWVSKDGDSVEKVSKIPVINTLFRERISREEKEVSQYSCPSCGHFLLKKPYDGTMIYQCKFCGGALVEDRKIPRIIARKSQEFSERIHRVSRMTLEKNQLKRIARNRKRADDAQVPLIRCPACNDPMMRTFYSHAYLIELDRCTCCSLTWFDYDELDMLQCMIDHKMASKPMPMSAETELTPHNS